MEEKLLTSARPSGGNVNGTRFTSGRRDWFRTDGSAGARLRRVERKADVGGLDPNKWFGNVEVVAAREIARQTVQYVSNIYKYYVSYTVIAAQRVAQQRAKGHP